MSARQIETDNEIYNNGDIASNWLKGYGFQNWQCDVPGIWRADGAFGQFGLVIPQKNAVILLTSCALNTEAELNIVFDTLLPAMKGDGAAESLPENPAALSSRTEKSAMSQIPTRILLSRTLSQVPDTLKKTGFR